jgi:type I restriction enzyme M protein
MNLAVRGIEGNLGPEWADSFHADAHPDLRADFVIANSPFNDSKWGGERLRQDPRWKYGVPPAPSANYAWLQHFLHHCAPTGIVGSVLANGSLKPTERRRQDPQSNGRRRRGGLHRGAAATAVLWHPNPVCLWFLTKNKAGVISGMGARSQQGETLFLDARQVGHMEGRTLRAFSPADITRVADAYHAWRGTETSERQPYADIPGFCRAVTTAEIAERNYIRTPGRYVGCEVAEVDGEPAEQKITRLSA